MAQPTSTAPVSGQLVYQAPLSITQTPIIDDAGVVHQCWVLPLLAQNKTTVLTRCLDQYGNPEAGVKVNIRLVGEVKGAGVAYDTAINSVISGSDGWASTTIPRQAGLRFQALRGDPDAGGRWSTFYGVDAESLQLPAIMANDA